MRDFQLLVSLPVCQLKSCVCVYVFVKTSTPETYKSALSVHYQYSHEQE
jgi:hypothetical protein